MSGYIKFVFKLIEKNGAISQGFYPTFVKLMLKQILKLMLKDYRKNGATDVETMLQMMIKLMLKQCQCLQNMLHQVYYLKNVDKMLKLFSYNFVLSRLFSMMHLVCFEQWNRPFPSCLLPLFQNDSWCTTFVMEISLVCKTINMHIKLISVRKAVHQDSFWNRGKRQLRNGLLCWMELDVMLCTFWQGLYNVYISVCTCIFPHKSRHMSWVAYQSA